MNKRKKRKMKQKKAAFEMSITTLVVIVIAVVLLILGLVFVRQIFGVATESVSIVDQQVKDKLKTMFGQEEGYVVVYNSETSIKPNSEGFRIPLAAKTRDGTTITNAFQYKIESVGGNCINAENWFVYPAPKIWKSFDAFEFDKGYIDLVLNVPKGTPLCTSIMKVAVKDSQGEFASKTFTIKIVRSGLF